MPLGLIGFLYSLKCFPDFRQPRGRFDALGFCIIGASVISMTAGLELTGGKTSSPTLAATLIVLGFAAVALYVFHARRSPSPLIALKVFRTPHLPGGHRRQHGRPSGHGKHSFLVPLMLQVGLGYSADVAGLIMLAPAIGSIMTKTVVLRLLHRFGYRHVLLFLTLAIAGMYLFMSLQRPGWPLTLLVIQLLVQGMFMSGQFTSMNTITLGELPAETASDGNSLLSVTQNLTVSFGVAISTALLRFFSGPSGELHALHCTFVAVGPHHPRPRPSCSSFCARTTGENLLEKNNTGGRAQPKGN